MGSHALSKKGRTHTSFLLSISCVQRPRGEKRWLMAAFAVKEGGENSQTCLLLEAFVNCLKFSFEKIIPLGKLLFILHGIQRDVPKILIICYSVASLTFKGQAFSPHLSCKQRDLNICQTFNQLNIQLTKKSCASRWP